MANCYLQIRCGNGPANMVVGREYDFRIDEDDSKLLPSDLLAVVEEIIENGLRQKYGEIYDLRGSVNDKNGK